MNTAFKTGNFQSGQTITTVSRQWLARSPDEKFTSLTDLRDSISTTVLLAQAGFGANTIRALGARASCAARRANANRTKGH